MQFRFHSRMAIFHLYLLQHFLITTVPVRMLVILLLILSNLFHQRNKMSAIGLVLQMSWILQFMFVTLTFDITLALWHLIMECPWSCNDRFFCSNITSEPIKSVLSRKPVHNSVSSKRLSRTSITTSFVESSIPIFVSRISTCLSRSSSVFNIQERCNLFLSGSFNIRIPLQNVLTQQIFFYVFTFLLNVLYVVNMNVIKINVFISFFSGIYNGDQINLFKEIFCITYFTERHLFTFHFKNISFFNHPDWFCCFAHQIFILTNRFVYLQY